jgi:hypothetical protein
MSVWVKKPTWADARFTSASPDTDIQKKAPGKIISGGLLDRRDWVHPPTQRCSSRHLATRSCAVCGSDASPA